jgi:hypothetical protein
VKSTAEKIEVMQAFLAGKKIETTLRTKIPFWQELKSVLDFRGQDSVEWNWTGRDYRVKEEPVVRWAFKYPNGAASGSVWPYRSDVELYLKAARTPSYEIIQLQEVK